MTYFVNSKKFDDLLKAIDFCKSKPNSVLKNSNNKVLMKHRKVSFNTFLDIELARYIFRKQLKQTNKSYA